MTVAQANTLHYWLFGYTTKTTNERRQDLRDRWSIDDEAILLTGVHLDLGWLTEIGVITS